MEKKNRRRFTRNLKAVSIVVSAIILCAAVVAVGGLVWGFALNSSSIMQMNYFKEVIVRADKMKERFITENVQFYNESSILRVWVYNYGEIDVNVTVYVYYNGSSVGHLNGYQAITRGTIKQLDITVQQPVSLGDEFIVKVISERENVEYERYLVL